MKKALITGITGQDGAYLAEFLLKGYMNLSIVFADASKFERRFSGKTKISLFELHKNSWNFIPSQKYV